MIDYRYDTQLLIEGTGLDEDAINDYFRTNFQGDCLLAVGDDVKAHALIEQGGILAGQHERADRAQQRRRVAVAMDVQIALVPAGAHERRDLAQHPDHAERMIGMTVREVEVAHAFIRQGGRLHLAEDAVAAARIHKQDIAAGRAEGKAGVVAARGHRVAGAEDDEPGRLFAFRVHGGPFGA